MYYIILKGGKTMYKSIRVTEDLHRDLRILSATEEKSIMEMLRVLIDEHIKNSIKNQLEA